MDNRYNRHNRRKYSLKVHIVLVTKYRKQLLQGSIADDVKQKILDIANTRGYEIVAMETDKDHIHMMIRSEPKLSPLQIARRRKQHTTYGKSIIRSYQNSIGRKKYFGQMVILLVALEKCHQQLYKNILRVKDNR